MTQLIILVPIVAKKVLAHTIASSPVKISGALWERSKSQRRLKLRSQKFFNHFYSKRIYSILLCGNRILVDRTSLFVFNLLSCTSEQALLRFHEVKHVSRTAAILEHGKAIAEVECKLLRSNLIQCICNTDWVFSKANLRHF